MNKWKKCCAVRLIIQSAGAGAAIVIHCEVRGLSRKISSRRSGEGAKKSVLCKHGMSGGVSCVCCWYQRSPPSQQLVAKTDEIMISTNWIWNGHQPTQASCLPWLWPQILWCRWTTAAEIPSTSKLNPERSLLIFNIVSSLPHLLPMPVNYALCCTLQVWVAALIK